MASLVFLSLETGEITGTTLLDVGTGPTIYNLISAARHFQNIYLSDFCENSRNVMWRWLTKQPDCHDFSDFFQFVARKENLREPWETLEKDMRSNIKGILGCDTILENSLLVVSLLKVGGWIVYIDNTNCTFYEFGRYRFDSLPIERNDVTKAFEKAGCEIKSWIPFRRSEQCKTDDGDAFIVMTAQKTQ